MSVRKSRKEEQGSSSTRSMLTKSNWTRSGLVIGSVGILLLAGCAGGAETDGGSGSGPGEDGVWSTEEIVAQYGSTEIGDSWHGLALSIIEDRANGGESAAAALGQKYKGISADFNAVKQLGDLEAAIGAGMKAMNVVPLEAPSVNSFAPIACDAEVPFTTSYNSPAWKTPGEFCEFYNAYTAPNDFETGVITATKLVEALDGEGRIVHIQGLKGATANELRTAGVQSVLKKYPNIEVVTTLDTDWVGKTAYDKFAATLATETEPIDGVIAADDDLGVGAFNAAKAVGQAPLIVSSDGTREVLGIIKDNKNYLGTVDTGSTFIGGWLFVRAFDALHGYEPTPADTMIYWPINWVDQKTAGDTLAKIESAEYDWTKMSRVLYPDTWNTGGQLFKVMDPATVWQTQEKPAGYELPEGFSADDRKAADAEYAKHQN